MLFESLGLVWNLIGDVWQLLSFQFAFDCLLLFVLFKVAQYFLNRGAPGKTRPPRNYALSSAEFGKGKTIECVCPATAEKVGEVQAYTTEEVQEVVARARKAQQEWGKTTFEERRAVLRDLLQAVVDNQDEICRLSMQDSGKTKMEAEYGEILTTCEKIRYIVRHGADALKTESRSPPLMLFVKKARVEYHPLGVIGIIVPWNYPFHNVASAVVAALFSGNAAVVKASEYALSSKDFFEKLFREVLAKRGYNPELVTLVAGEGDTGAALVQSGVDKIFFIGSPGVGKLVMSGASRTLTPVTLELGGKDPFVVLDDAELHQAIDVALRGVFVNCGQNCIAAERIYVQDGIYDRFVEIAAERVRALRQGPAIQGGCFDCGSITMSRQMGIVDELVQDAVKNGARLMAGGKRNEQYENGLFYEPTMLVDLHQSMRIVNEEAFGPVMLVIRFSTDEEVVRMANATEYALGCSIFSTNYARAERMASEIVAGMCTINDFGVGYLIQALPFGGAKVSGFGRFNGPEGLREFSRIKSVVTDRFPMRTKPPRFTNYPIPDWAPSLVAAAIHVFYDKNVGVKAQNALTMVKLLLTGK